MAWESPLQRGSKSYSHKRRNVRFNGLRRVHTPPQPLTAHTAAYTAKQGAFRVGALSLPSDRFARFGNPVGLGVRTTYFAAFGPWSDVLPKNAESLRDSDALMRVDVPRRRGPAGLRDPVAVSLAALIDFAVLVVYDNSTRKHICRFHTPVCSMRLATRCRSFALSTAFIWR